MKKFREIISVVALICGLGLAFAPAANAVNVFDPCIDSNGNVVDSAVCKNTGDDANNIIKTVVDITIYAVAAVSVVVIIISGFIYATSSGEAAQIKKAKDTLTYAIAGMVIAICAYAIVNWVLGYIT